MSNIYQIKKRKSIKWILDHGHATIHGAKTSRPTAAFHAGTPVTPESRVVTEEGAFSCACHHPRLTFCSRRIPQTLEGRGPLYLASKKYLRVLRDSRQRLEDQRVMVTGFRKCNHGMRLSHRLQQCNSHLPGPSPMLPTSSDVHYPPRIHLPLHLHPPVLILPIPSDDFAFQLLTLTMQCTVSRWWAYPFYILVNLDIKLYELLWCNGIIRSIFMM